MRKIRNGFYRMLATVFAAAMVVTSVQLPISAAPKAKATANLVNIAPDCEITVPGEESGKAKENMVDGDPGSLWVASSGAWPSRVEFKLPSGNTKKIKKVIVKFEQGHTPWTVDIKLSHAVNNITSDLITDNEKQNHCFDNVYEFEYETPLSFTHTYIELSNPKDNGGAAGFWPAVAEVEILAEEDASESELVNVAPNAAVTSVGGDVAGRENLIDENYESLYVFYNGGISQIQGDAWIELALDKEYPVRSMEAAFELKDPDNDDFHFTFDVYGKGEKDTDWTPLFQGVEATRLKGSNIKELKLPQTKNLKNVRIVVTDITSGGGDPWPALAEFKVFADGNASATEDAESVAYKKPVRTNAGQATVSRVNDGSKTNVWSGNSYPAYIDIDLEKNYNLDEIQVFTPASGYSQYSIYTSMNGRDFAKLAEKTSKDSCPETGEKYDAKNTEARIVRVYMEYQSTSAKSLVNEIRVLGTESGTEVQPYPEVKVDNFEGSEYDVAITDDDTKEEVRGIIRRRVGDKYVDWFELVLEPNSNQNQYDYFELSQKGNKIQIKGNDGVSLATGLNHYLKYYCNVNISQVGDQVEMPESIVPIEGTVHKETKFPVRYSYNYCTLSYSMAFWGEKEWRNELDWLALNGVNVVLDATAQEEVWRRFLGELGYTHEEVKDFIAGPAYYAWAYMANLSGFGGPVHDSWFVERTDLARKNQLIMRKLGMQPVLQGYSGMVPVDITAKDSSVQVIPQGTWCSFQRPSMLRTDSAKFTEYAAKFYQAQKEVYGDVSDYYATDPFHEGGDTGGMNPSVISRLVLENMMKADADANWIIQSWQGNPSTALLQGLGDHRDHALVLDLYAEKTPHWNSTDPNAYGGAEGGGEFLNTPWVYCMLNNFGGRLGLHGHIQNFVDGVANAANTADHMAGIGITPEASVNNPVLYDLFFETIWADDAGSLTAINLDDWFKKYTTRRYGAESDNAYQAMQILNDTVYNPALNDKGQGAPESVVNARPREDIKAASTWGNSVIDYDKAELERAAGLLLDDYEKLKDSPGYQYDLANVLEQILSNTAQEYQKRMTNAYRAKDAETFQKMSERFLGIIDKVEEVTGTQKDFMVGTWIEAAKALAENADDFTKELYELNARGLITTWGSIEQANSGSLSDYSNRQWSGLTKDYYKMRWQKWIDERTKELAGEEFKNYSASEWFEMEWEWARSNNSYPTTPNGMNLKTLGEEILTTYSVSEIPKDPAENDEFDLPTEGMTVTTGSQQAETGTEGPAANVLDGQSGTIWHSSWNGTDRSNLWIDICLGESKDVNGLRMLPRTGGGNGVITKYRIEISNDNGASYREVASGEWSNNDSWKIAEFAETQATNVRLYAVESVSDKAGLNFASAAEIRIMTPKKEEPQIITAELEKAIQAAQERLAMTDSYKAEDLTELQTKVAAAQALVQNPTTQAEVDQAKTDLEEFVKNMQELQTFKITATAGEGGSIDPSGEVAVKEGRSQKFVITASEGYEIADVKVDDKSVGVVTEYTFQEVTANGKIEVSFRKTDSGVPEKVDKTELNTKLVEAEGLLKLTDKYTAETLEKLQKAVDAAKLLMNAEDASQEDVDAAAQAIAEAVKGLEEIKTAPTPNPNDKNGKDNKGTVKTGDTAGIMGWMLMMAAAAAGILTVLKKRTR